MRITTPLAVVAAGVAVVTSAAPALATTKATTKVTVTATTKASVCKVIKDGRLTVTAKVAKTSKTKGGTETISKGTKEIAHSAFVVGKADSVCLAPGAYKVTLKTTKGTVTLNSVSVKKDKTTKRSVVVR